MLFHRKISKHLEKRENIIKSKAKKEEKCSKCYVHLFRIWAVRATLALITLGIVISIISHEEIAENVDQHQGIYLFPIFHNHLCQLSMFRCFHTQVDTHTYLYTVLVFIQSYQKFHSWK